MKTLALIVLSILTISTAPAIKQPEILPEPAPEIAEAQNMNSDPFQTETPLTEPLNEPKEIEKKAPTPVEVDVVKENPQNCDHETQWIWADGSCHNKQATPDPAPQSTGGPQGDRVPIGVHDIGGSGSCETEIAKYDWNQTVARAVAVAESGLRPGVINNNPSTFDYSIGCFQVNIYGANAASRPPQGQLIDAAINVRWAYNNYVSNGHSFIGQWGVCRKISCY